MNIKSMNFKFFLSLLAFSSIYSYSIAQNNTHIPSNERSSFEGLKNSIMDGNQLRATYFNNGHSGRLNSSSLQQLIFEYPRNTGRNYMYFASLMYGTEVQDESTPEDDKFAIVDVAFTRTSRDGRQSWSVNPIDGYNRDDSDEMARSDRGPGSPLGNTWPNAWPDKFQDGGDGWSGSWNGFFGRDQFNADVEFYYKAGDDTYTRYLSRYKPDTTDPTRGGLGLILDTRILAWSQRLVQDVHFNLFELKNDGSYDYNRMAFGVWIADFVAGGGATNRPVFDNLRAIAYLTDTNRERSPNQFDGPIGQMGLKFLETPGNASDGIDNDGDSDTYNGSDSQNLFDPDNTELFGRLTGSEGFYNYATLTDTVIRVFEAPDFEERTISIGDKIVLIQSDNSRVISTYDGTPFVSQGVTWDFNGVASFNVLEDILPQEDANFGIHIDGLDNDFDGLIDENTPNHLTKSTFNEAGLSIIRPVRFINYMNFMPGDTLQRGLIVPNQSIRERINTDPAFATIVNDIYGGKLQNYFTSAPMIDEGRDDFFDNDDDWNILIDDVGIEGDPNSISQGKGDGLPSSGARTTFPGEPSIDKTDVSETDLIGVTRAQVFPIGSVDTNLDEDVWTNFLIPGEFTDNPGTDSDIFVSSGLFPIARGSSERFAIAITAAQEKTDNASDDRAKVDANLNNATVAYESDYQFAVAPKPPILQAVASDGKVTLYWNTESEQSFDRYIANQTGDGFDFEGYKIYRTTDVSFQEIFSITDGLGSSTFLRPLAIYDLKNGIRGFHPVSENGVQFNLGNDTGLERIFEDTNVINGRTYYYAVTAFDRGFTAAEISPSESPVQISLNPDGTVTFGQNVVSVRPTSSQAGYISPEKPFANIASGSPGGTVSVDIIDPAALNADNLYDIVFEDSVYDGGISADTLKTSNFTLRNVTNGSNDTLISKSLNFNGDSNPVTEGFTVTLNNVDTFGLDENRSGWKYDSQIPPHDFVFTIFGAPKVSDYEIIIGESVGFGQSVAKTIEVSPGNFQNLTSQPTNFKLVNTYSGEETGYAFLDLNSPTSNQQRCNPTFIVPDNYVSPVPGQLSAVAGAVGRCSDIIYFVEDYRGIQDTLTLRISMSAFLQEGALLTQHPQPGDTLKIFTTKPFSQNDRFTFRFDPDNIPQISQDSVKNSLDEILVIPNPYKVANIYENAITQTNRQHNRELHFTQMPAPSTLRIFTASGVLVKEINIQPSDLIGDYGGTYIWNMLTKDNLEISYGIYLYHVQVPGIGEKLGKFAVIK